MHYLDKIARTIGVPSVQKTIKVMCERRVSMSIVTVVFDDVNCDACIIAYEKEVNESISNCVYLLDLDTDVLGEKSTESIKNALKYFREVSVKYNRKFMYAADLCYCKSIPRDENYKPSSDLGHEDGCPTRSAPVA